MSAPFSFQVQANCPTSGARCATFETPHGAIQTPAFMPVGTRGTVKGVLPRDLRESGSTMVLANTLHLFLRPGPEAVREIGGLHTFMGWDGPILTDSGGYQVFSMADLAQINRDGVTFRSIVDGKSVRFTPEVVMDVQRDLGADVIMAFDHCPTDPTDRAQVQAATDRTHHWLDRCVRQWQANGGLEGGQALFGIVQGGTFEDLRAKSVEAVCSHDLAGVAVGGVSVGEDREHIRNAFALALPLLPPDRPRYLMGIGTPRDFFDAIRQGADLFDCVTPTRHGRNHQVYTSRGRINVRNEGWSRSTEALDPECPCPACTEFPLGSLRHFCKANEMLAGSLLSLHNLYFFHRLLQRMRTAIAEGSLDALEAEVLPRVEKRQRPLDAG
ncbi:MAG: tRNA guanosine(34) transglycosylase Tgt [Planctomycetes bacterium]|nr:tRNA guanosine(34) transglycosylase Tgt [Planctomycetota bacterium]